MTHLHYHAHGCRTTLFLRLLVICIFFLQSCGRQAPSQSLQNLPDNHSVVLATTFNPNGFTNDRSMSGYHLIVWKKGKAAAASLFQAEVSDRKLLRRLTVMGAKPSNNLKLECWSCRQDRGHPAPDLKAEGPVISVEYRLPNEKKWTPVYKLFVGIDLADVDFRFTGNEKFIDVWKSGCISCLYSCPGGKISNAAYTIRDYTKSNTRFRLVETGLPRQGSRVMLKMTLKEAK